MIRIFDVADTVETARVWHQAGLEEYAYLPTFQALDESTAVDLFRNVILTACEVWIEESATAIRGFIALNGSYIDRLYVHPTHQKLGVGGALLSHAKRLYPQGLELHTHQQNHRARSFYEKSGFNAVKLGTSPPPESAPDVEYHWRAKGDTQQ